MKFRACRAGLFARRAEEKQNRAGAENSLKRQRKQRVSPGAENSRSAKKRQEKRKKKKKEKEKEKRKKKKKKKKEKERDEAALPRREKKEAGEKTRG